MHFPFLVIISPPEQWPGNSFYCLGHYKNVYDDDDDDDDFYTTYSSAGGECG